MDEVARIKAFMFGDTMTLRAAILDRSNKITNEELGACLANLCSRVHTVEGALDVLAPVMEERLRKKRGLLSLKRLMDEQDRELGGHNLSPEVDAG